MLKNWMGIFFLNWESLWPGVTAYLHTHFKMSKVGQRVKVSDQIML